MFALGQEQGVMPDIEAIQAENKRVIAESYVAEQKGSGIVALRQEMQSEIEMMPVKIGIGGIIVVALIYWFLIKR